ncbi:hypothetical protein HZA40_02210 [Candidatus Peregrinibacteria bacterium]|nr:hypothetical protein [Candidatus Peregrinibacteria bacterium]
MENDKNKERLGASTSNEKNMSDNGDRVVIKPVRDESMAEIAALLPEVAKRGLHRRKGFVSLGEFAGKIAGMSEYAVDRIL